MLKRSPFCDEVFVFFNKKLDKLQLLWWDRNGFWLAYKRLEKGRFAAFPKAPELSRGEPILLLEGVDLRTQRLGKVECESVN